MNPENILREAGNTGTILLLKNEISGVVGACAQSHGRAIHTLHGN